MRLKLKPPGPLQEFGDSVVVAPRRLAHVPTYTPLGQLAWSDSRR